MTMTLITAQRIDLASYIDLLEEIGEWLNDRGLGQVPNGMHRECVEYYAESIANGEVYLGLMGSHIVASFRLLREDSMVWPEEGGDALYLHTLAVRRAWSGQGLGQQMLNWAEQQASLSGKTFLRLDCFANNRILRRYYENAGYKDRGEIDVRYPFGTLQLQRFEKQIR
jgi:GNAT superfamily N-acetyltransferase